MPPRDPESPYTPRGIVENIRKVGFFITEALGWSASSETLPSDSVDLTKTVLVGGAPAPPTRIGPYDIVEVLGQGGMGVVYRARDLQLGREVAVKVLKGLAVPKRKMRRFIREGEVTAALQHPGIVRIFASGEHDGMPYLAYELVEGARTLGEAVEGLALDGKIHLVLQAARAVGYAHEQGVIHRDLKPDNILVDARGRVRVADFGLATAEWLERITQTGVRLGTPYFMSPEQFHAARSAVGPASDVWSLGVVLYKVLTGNYPFEAQTVADLGKRITDTAPPPPRSVNPVVTPALEAVVLRALHKDPRSRYPDANTLADDIDLALAGGEPTPAPPPPRGWSWVPATVGLVCVLGLAAGLVWSQQRSPTPAAEGPVLRLTLEAPSEGLHTWAEAVDLRGRVDGGTADVRVRVGGASTQASPGEPFSLRVPLRPGENRIEVRAGGTRIVRRVVRRTGPAWWQQVPPARRPPLPLPAGITFGATPRTYRNARDGSELVWIPPGTFTMGRRIAHEAIVKGEHPPHPVQLTRGYFLGKHEVTWKQYRAFCRATGHLPPRAHYGGDDHPVNTVNWFDAQAYCRWAGGRLPTEAEWAYAARGPESRMYPWGSEPAKPGDDRAHLLGSGRSHPVPVGSYPRGASPFGCLDMIGNVSEWVHDWMDVYAAEPLVDPRGPDPTRKSGRLRDHRRVVRGGSYLWEPHRIRATTRLLFAPYDRSGRIGLRLCVPVGERPAPATPAPDWQIKAFRYTAHPLRAVERWRRTPGQVSFDLPRLRFDFGKGGFARLPGLPARVQEQTKAVGDDQFGVIATATMALAPGQWAIGAVTNDGLRVWLDGQLVIDGWRMRHASKDYHPFTINKRRPVQLRVEYFEATGDALLTLDVYPIKR